MDLVTTIVVIVLFAGSFAAVVGLEMHSRKKNKDRNSSEDISKAG